MALDYHIDRPRVMAVRFDPPYVQADRPLTINALALAPRGQVIRSLTASTCIEDPLAETTNYFDLSCLGEVALATPLGELPAAWVPPGAECTEDTGYQYQTYYADTGADTGSGGYYYDSCTSNLPILVEARTTDGVGYGNVFVTVPKTATEGTPMWGLEQSLTATGEPRAGREVALEYTIATSEVSLSYPGFHWYVDAGELLETGVTSASSVSPGVTSTRNTLRIPEDWKGTLRVAVVATQDGYYTAGADTTWRVLVLDVP